MAWEKGTADGYRDLLEKLKIFASANGWKVERWVKDSVDPVYPAEGVDELILSSTGPSGIEFLIVGFNTTFNRTSDYYNFRIKAGAQYSAGASWEEQPQSSPVNYIYLWQNPIDYYLLVDKARILLIAQVSGTTHACYLGKLQMYCSLGHWPRQVGCFGEGVREDGRWSAQGNDYSHFQWFRNNARHVLWMDGNYFRPTEILPHMTTYSCLTYNGGQNSKQHWLMPMVVIDNDRGAIGEFIGCYYTDGHDSSTMSIFKSPDGLREFLIIQNIYRNTNKDFMAVELK